MCNFPSCFCETEDKCRGVEPTVIDDKTLFVRLDNLYAMLEEEGYYTKANTVYLAKNRIQRLLEGKSVDEKP